MQQHEIINVRPRRQKLWNFGLTSSYLISSPHPTPPHLDMVPILAPLFLPTNQNRNPPPFIPLPLLPIFPFPFSSIENPGLNIDLKSNPAR